MGLRAVFVKGARMAIQPIISNASYARLNAEKRGSSTDTPSAVQRQLTAKKTEEAKAGDYEKSDDFYKLKAYELKKRIALYGNLGLTDLQQQAQDEATTLVKEYQALQKQKAAEEAAASVSESTGLDIQA